MKKSLMLILVIVLFSSVFANGCDYVYDGVGNLLSKTCGVEITSYSYDANNMIKSIQLPIGETLSFEYDALGRRVKKVYDNRITWYSYGLSDSPLLENHNN